MGKSDVSNFENMGVDINSTQCKYKTVQHIYEFYVFFVVNSQGLSTPTVTNKSSITTVKVGNNNQ